MGDIVQGGKKSKTPKIEVVNIGGIKIYQVLYSELKELKDGNDEGHHKEIGIFFLSSGLSLMLSLLTSPPAGDIQEGIIYATIPLFIVFGLIMLNFHRKSKSRKEELFQEITTRGEESQAKK